MDVRVFGRGDGPAVVACLGEQDIIRTSVSVLRDYLIK